MNKEETNINMDFTDIFSCLKRGESHELVEAQAEGKEAAKKVIEKVVANITGFSSVKSVMLNFELHPDYPMMELMDGVEAMNTTLDDKTEILFGTKTDDSLEIDFVKVSVVFVLEFDIVAAMDKQLKSHESQLESFEKETVELRNL